MHSINLVGTGKQFSCREDQYLLQGMQVCQFGKKMLEAIPVGCRGGGCGICRIRIISGEYEAKKMSCKHIPKANQAQGFALACCIYPRGDLDITVLPVSVEVEKHQVMHKNKE